MMTQASKTRLVGLRPGAKKIMICQAISAISQDIGLKIETKV